MNSLASPKTDMESKTVSPKLMDPQPPKVTKSARTKVSTFFNTTLLEKWAVRNVARNFGYLLIGRALIECLGFPDSYSLLRILGAIQLSRIAIPISHDRLRITTYSWMWRNRLTGVRTKFPNVMLLIATPAGSAIKIARTVRLRVVFVHGIHR